MKITAVVVTCNRSEKLEKTVASLLSGRQVPDEIVVIDNHSKPDEYSNVKAICDPLGSVYMLRTNKNIGGAGGFALGIKVAFERGASHLWVMDDDVYVLEDSLYSLTSKFSWLEDQGEWPGFICSKVNWVDGEICEMNQPATSWDWSRKTKDHQSLVKVDSCSFVSCFFSSKAVEKVGLPLVDFFIWYDDVEYTRRISAIAPCYIDLDSVVVHDTPENKGVNFSFINDSNVWKYEYGARNEAWYLAHRSNLLRWLSFFLGKRKDMRAGGVSRKNKIRIYKACVFGAFKKMKVLKVNDMDVTRYVDL